MTSDEALILELRGGSQEAFTELFLRYRQRVYGFFRRRMGDAAQAEELAQEAFLAVLRGAQRYEPRATFRAAPGTRVLRPGTRTSLPGLFLAGAWTDTGWPATMEGAVRSGLAAARAALAARHRERVLA